MQVRALFNHRQPSRLDNDGSGLPGTYRVELAPTPTGPWTVLEINLPGTGTPIQITDTAPPPSASRFYRIVAE